MTASSIARIPSNAPVRTEFITILHSIAADLAKWLHGQFLRHGGKKWWENHVCGIVHEKDEWRITEGHWKQLEDMDLAGLLNVLSANFRFLRARNAIGKEDWELLLDMREVRNRCEGHWPVKHLACDEVNAHLDSISRFSVRFGGGKNLTEQVASLRAKLQDLATGVESQIFGSDQLQIKMAPAVQVEETKRLQEFFVEHKLTPSQANGVEALQQFLDDPDSQCFVLKGYAGTGKTFLIGGLVRYLQSCNRKPEMLAPTGRAAHVIRERHQVEASTIHRHIYSLNTLEEYRELNESGDVTYKFYFDLKNNDTEHDTVFIVDEASMISDIYSEAEFMHFGSGRLLSDLLHYINFDANRYRKKLILVGDDAQLPPFGMSIPPALDEAYLGQRRGIRSLSSTLTDVVRQADSSLIVKNATQIRELIRDGRFPSFEFVSDGDQVREMSADALLETFVRERGGSLTPDMVIITDTNASTRTYNDAVRNRLFPGIASLTKGDQIIVARNNYRCERPLMNGQMGQVVESARETEVRTVYLNIGTDDEGKRKNVSVQLEFREVNLRFSDDLDGYFDLSCKISENFLLNSLPDHSSNYSKALYVDFRNRHPHLNPSQPEFKEVLKTDVYFNAVMLKFGYAITCHKAQGGEWPTVFINFSGKNKLDTESLRWSYTAITRARERVVATSALHQPPLKPLKGMSSNSPSHSAPPRSENSGGNDKESPVQPIPGPQTPTELIRSLIAGVIPEGWEIDSLRSLQWEEQFILMSEGRQVPISVYYNGKPKISRVKVRQTRGQDQFDGEVAAILAKLKGKSVSLASFTDPGEHIDGIHQDFSEALKGRLRTAGIRLVGLRSNTIYHLTARLEWKGTETSVNYYIDGMGRFTRFLPQPGCPPDLYAQLEIIHA